MKKVAKKNLKLDKEVIASLSENEMVGVIGGGNPNGESVIVKDTRITCNSHETGCRTHGVVCGGETGNCIPLPVSSGCESNTNSCIPNTINCLCSQDGYENSCFVVDPNPSDPIDMQPVF